MRWWHERRRRIGARLAPAAAAPNIVWGYIEANINVSWPREMVIMRPEWLRPAERIEEMAEL